MKPAILSHDAYLRAVTLRDLSDPAQGPHVMQQLIDRITAALGARWGCGVRVHRAHPVVPVEHNYDRLHYPPDGAARDARYTRYVSETAVLRTQTSAMIPPLLADVARNPPADVLLACPGLVYRRDEIDRLHTGEPHQMDLWRVAERKLGAADLHEMVAVAVDAVLPGREYRCNPADHPLYRRRRGDRGARGRWMGGGGRVRPGAPGDPGRGRAPGAALVGAGDGAGDGPAADAKGMDDIRILRSAESRISGQMLDLEPYRPVSAQPPIRRDVSLAVEASRTPEELGDRVRQALGERVESLESVEVLSQTGYDALPAVARERIGMGPGQKNVLVRIVIRDLVRTLTRDEANALRDAVYASLHEGSAWQWASAAA
jgi:phenylalanyl-tRNA synthetase alpha chain